MAAMEAVPVLWPSMGLVIMDACPVVENVGLRSAAPAIEPHRAIILDPGDISARPEGADP
jgi:hypothetical protein